MDRPKRKKIYYIPGIISLAVLPIAFFFFAKRKIQHSTIWTIPIFWADTAFMNKQDILFSSFNRKYPPERNYTDIIFTGNEDDISKLVNAQIRIREIIKANDTSNGLHFVFGDSANYGTFIAVVNKLRLEGAKTYMPIDNNLWFYNFRVNTMAKQFKYDCLLCNDVTYFEPEISWRTKTKEAVVASWQIMLLYCGFIISVLALLTQNKGS